MKQKHASECGGCLFGASPVTCVLFLHSCGDRGRTFMTNMKVRRRALAGWIYFERPVKFLLSSSSFHMMALGSSHNDACSRPGQPAGQVKGSTPRLTRFTSQRLRGEEKGEREREGKVRGKKRIGKGEEKTLRLTLRTFSSPFFSSSLYLFILSICHFLLLICVPQTLPQALLLLPETLCVHRPVRQPQ